MFSCFANKLYLCCDNYSIIKQQKAAQKTAATTNSWMSSKEPATKISKAARLEAIQTNATSKCVWQMPGTLPLTSNIAIPQWN